MRTKLLWLSIPIIFSISGIIYLQIDWMQKNYILEFDSINKISDFALTAAVTKLNEENIEEASQALMKELPTGLNRVDIKRSQTFDSLIVTIHDNQSVESGLNVVKTSINIGRLKFNMPNSVLGSLKVNKATHPMDVILGRISKSLAYKSNITVDLKDSLKLADYFKENLKKADLNVMPSEMELVFFRGDFKTIMQQKNNVVVPEVLVALGTGFKLYQSAKLSSFNGERTWVGAYFHSHQKQIIARMMYGSLLSIILIVFMMVSFIYLIGLLLKQKRIAQMKDDFISSLTHEFKTPISTISAAMEAMQNFNALKDPVKTERYLRVSRAELSRLDTMVTNVLDIASYENNTLQLDLQLTDIEALINEAVTSENFRAEKPVEFLVSIDAAVINLKVDRDHFRNVIVNLIDNAIKYSTSEAKISIKAVRENSQVCLTVEDHGIGISPSDVMHIFEKFYRVQKGNIYNVKGTGIGLSYVKSIIELHKGTIDVKSTLNIGTTFIIYLPLA